MNKNKEEKKYKDFIKSLIDPEDRGDDFDSRLDAAYKEAVEEREKKEQTDEHE